MKNPVCAVCPVDCCVPDEMYQETVEELMAKKEKLHIIDCAKVCALMCNMASIWIKFFIPYT